MTLREIPGRQLFLSVAFAVLGIWGLAQAKYFSGAIYLVFGVAWLLIAAKDRIGAARKQ